jgi:hypothetical protein
VPSRKTVIASHGAQPSIGADQLLGAPAFFLARARSRPPRKSPLHRQPAEITQLPVWERWHAGCTLEGRQADQQATDTQGKGAAMITRTFGLLLGTILSVSAVLSGAHAADKVKLKMAEVVRSQFYVPMYVAMSKGFVADEGLEVELITANGGDRAGAMLLSGPSSRSPARRCRSTSTTANLPTSR